MRSKRVKIFAGVLILVVIAGVIGFRVISARAQSSTGNNLQTATVTRGSIASTVVAAGSVRARQAANLSWGTTGVVGKVDVQIGDQVKAGQVLASLDPNNLPLSIINAQTDLVSQQQALNTLMTSQTPQAQAMQAVQNAQQALDDYLTNFPANQAKAYADLVTAQQNYTTTVNKRLGLNYSRASQGTVDAAQANYDMALNALKQAQDDYAKVSNLAETDQKRLQALVNMSNAETKVNSALGTLNWYLGKPSTTDFSAADAAVAQAKAAVATAQSAYNKVKDGPDPTQLAILKAALADAQTNYNLIKDGPNPNDVAALKNKILTDQETINQQNITALFDGTVTDVSVLPNDQAAPGQAAFQVEDLSHLLVDVSVAEIDIPKVAIGQDTTMTFDALPGKTYHGKVVEVSQVGTSTQGVVNFNVTVQFSDNDQNVRPGMTAAVSIITQQKTNVLLVPNRAIQNTGGQRNVTVLFEGNQIQVPVTIGIVGSTESEITSNGLKEGDTVVLNSSASTTTTGRNGGGFGGGGFGGGGGLFLGR